MRKKFLILMMLVATATFAAAANVGIAGTGGVLAGSNAGLTLSGETLSIDGSIVGALGSITLSTASLLSGDLGDGARFHDGGTITITGNGTGGVHSGVIFAGVFDDLKWKLITSGGQHFYDLIGSLKGTLFTGQKVNGAFTLLTESAGKGFFDGSVKVASTDISLQVAPVPEPTSLLYLGTGLAGMAACWKKWRHN